MKIFRTISIALTSFLGFLSGYANATSETDFWQWFQRNEGALFEFERDQERTFDRKR
jgi:hypothetical protein